MDQGFFLAASESIHLPERKISDFYHALGSAQCEPSLATGITACGTHAAVDLLRLGRVRGTTGFDGLERISTQTLLDILQVAQRQRTAGSYRHLAALMTELGWAAVRVRDFNGRGFKEQVRGYVRSGHAPRKLREPLVRAWQSQGEKVAHTQSGAG